VEKQQDNNFYDDLQTGFDPAEALRQQKDDESGSERLDYLIHKVFEQTPEGKELIGKWKDALIMTPTVESGIDMAESGIREGQKRFIRGIILTINRVEKGE
jgi:hypothetical protein